jgi:hypothetical protein
MTNTRSKRPKRDVETTGRRGYMAMLHRMIRRAGERAANGDEIELAELLTLKATYDAAVQTAVDGIRARGNSWAYIAKATGTSREAAYQKWGKK